MIIEVDLECDKSKNDKQGKKGRKSRRKSMPDQGVTNHDVDPNKHCTPAKVSTTKLLTPKKIAKQKLTTTRKQVKHKEHQGLVEEPSQKNAQRKQRSSKSIRLLQELMKSKRSPSIVGQIGNFTDKQPIIIEDERQDPGVVQPDQIQPETLQKQIEPKPSSTLLKYVKVTPVTNNQLKPATVLFASLGCKPERVICGCRVQELEQRLAEKGNWEPTFIEHILMAKRKRVKLRNCDLRRVHIQLHDSAKVLRGTPIMTKSQIIRGRRPFKQDECLINYDLSSDDDLQELCCEEIENSLNIDEEKDESQSSSDRNFIFDGDLVVEDSLSQHGPKIKSQSPQIKHEAIDQPIRENKQPYMMLFRGSTTSQSFSNYSIQPIADTKDIQFPLAIKRTVKEKNAILADVPSAWNLIDLINGSKLSFLKLAEIFKQSHQGFSKYLIEKTIKMIATKQGQEGQGETWQVQSAVMKRLNYPTKPVPQLITPKPEQIEIKKQEAKKPRGKLVQKIINTLDKYINRGK